MRTYLRKHDRKAKRIRFWRFTTINKNLFDEFIEQNPESAIKDYKTFQKLLIFSNEQIAKKAIDDRTGALLPDNLGRILLKTYKPPFKVYDKKRSNEYGYDVETKNYETDGLVGKIFYSITRRKFANKNNQMWAFRACRKFKTDASAAFRSNITKYIRKDLNDNR